MFKEANNFIKEALQDQSKKCNEEEAEIQEKHENIIKAKMEELRRFEQEQKERNRQREKDEEEYCTANTRNKATLATENKLLAVKLQRLKEMKKDIIAEINSLKQDIEGEEKKQNELAKRFKELRQEAADASQTNQYANASFFTSGSKVDNTLSTANRNFNSTPIWNMFADDSVRKFRTLIHNFSDVQSEELIQKFSSIPHDSQKKYLEFVTQILTAKGTLKKGNWEPDCGSKCAVMAIFNEERTCEHGCEIMFEMLGVEADQEKIIVRHPNECKCSDE